MAERVVVEDDRLHFVGHLVVVWLVFQWSQKMEEVVDLLILVVNRLEFPRMGEVKLVELQRVPLFLVWVTLVVMVILIVEMVPEVVWLEMRWLRVRMCLT